MARRTQVERRPDTGPSHAGAAADSADARRVVIETAESPAVVPAVSATKPTAARPRGVKRTKAAFEESSPVGAAVERLAEYVTSMSDAMALSNRRKADLSGLALEAKLVDMLEAGPAKQTMVQNLLRRTRQSNTAAGSSAAPAQQRTEAGVTRQVNDIKEE